MSNAQTIRKKMRENPHCYWCGIVVRLDRKLHMLKPGQVTLPDVATIDHVISRLDLVKMKKSITSDEGKKLRRFTVLACYKCNQDRSRDDEKFMRKHQWKVSGLYPIWHYKTWTSPRRLVESIQWFYRIRIFGRICMKCSASYHRIKGKSSQQYCEKCYTKIHHIAV